jgi:hypothetical protein
MMPSFWREGETPFMGGAIREPRDELRCGVRGFSGRRICWVPGASFRKPVWMCLSDLSVGLKEMQYKKESHFKRWLESLSAAGILRRTLIHGGWPNGWRVMFALFRSNNRVLRQQRRNSKVNRNRVDVPDCPGGW